MHWHSPSEHRIDGQQHFVSLFPSLSHTNATISARPALDSPDHHVLAVEVCSRASSGARADDGSVSVVSILLQLGHPDPVIEKIQNKLRELAKDVHTSNEQAPVTVGPFHPTEMRKNGHKYYKYIGSFTAPPCTENVTWIILAKVRSISKGQVEALKAPLDMRCKNNNRSVQESNGRLVELYEEQLNHV